MNVLIACEESQVVCTAFRERGHNAFSCDIMLPSGSHPEWHILGDVLPILNGGDFSTMDGKQHNIPKWDLIIAHPPCTRLCSSGQRWLYYGDDEYREKKLIEQQEGIAFFMTFVEAANKIGVKMAIENPVGIMSSIYRKPDCIYNPYDFAPETECKKTCLWLFNGLKPLQPNQNIPKEQRTHGIWLSRFNGKYVSYSSPECAKMRSKTPPGVAKAMAEQWG